MKIAALFSITLFAIGLGVTGCAATPAIRVDRDPAVDLRSYRTFGFLEAAATGGSYTTLVAGRLKEATRAELERQGYVYSESNPSLRVNIVLAVVERQKIQASAAPGPFFYRGWGGYPDVDTVNYRQGTLRIDLVDPARHALVWRGVAEGRVNEKTLKNQDATIGAVVSELFAEFPGRGA